MDTSQSNSQPTKPVSPASTLTTLVFLVALGIAIWLDFTEKWPVTKIIDFQASIFDGSYYPKMTFMITLLMVWLPMFAVEKLVIVLIKKN